ncbi:hypothetical protein ACSQ67_016139 [Phaseolus vulgaris]
MPYASTQRLRERNRRERAAACGDSGGRSARPSGGFSPSIRGAAFSNNGVLCAAAGGNSPLTLPSKLGATVGDGGGDMGRSGGDGGSEGVGSAFGREEEARQRGGRQVRGP